MGNIQTLPLLEHPLVDYFDMPEGPDQDSLAVLQWLSGRVHATGAQGWYRTSFLGREEVWLETVLPRVSGTGVEVDLLVRSWQPKNWRGGPEQRLWVVRLMVGLDCQCWRYHGVHYVLEETRECGSPAAFRQAVESVLQMADRWARDGRDASRWYAESGLPDGT
ncbi:MAG: hypothetical protein M3Q48_01260, partial [Actinomycetota bacterium]|nr:hypothetical protein [Actinomycetota bacterium]